MRSLVKRAVTNLVPGASERGWTGGLLSGGLMSGNFLSFARNAYAGNAIIYAGMNLIATSAAEPHIVGKRWRRNKRVSRRPGDRTSNLWDSHVITVDEARQQADANAAYLKTLGITNRAGRRMLDAWLIRNGFFEMVEEHPLVKLLNNPNPFMSRGRLWGMMVLDYYLAGNAYLLKARYKGGILQGAVGELWRLRPDRVRVIPSPTNFIAGYEYTPADGSPKVTFGPHDVIHFKTLNPLDEYYGMPPLMSVTGRMSIDRYMETFLREFFENGGSGPGAILAVKGKNIPQKDKDEARDRMRRMFGPGNYHDTLIIDNAESVEYTQLGLNRGLRDALPKEIDAQTEARLSMVLGVPGSILGTLIGYESSSYANKRSDWQVLWDITMTPLLGSFDDVLNMSLVPEFEGIDEVCFDLSDIRALQEDEDKMQDRARKNYQAGGLAWEEFRDAIGMDPNVGEGLFFIPSSGKLVPLSKLGEEPDPAQLPEQRAAAALRDMVLAFEKAPLQIEGPNRGGRPSLESDPEARALWERGERLRDQFPGITEASLASRLGVAERTWRRYRATFDTD